MHSDQAQTTRFRREDVTNRVLRVTAIDDPADDTVPFSTFELAEVRSESAPYALLELGLDAIPTEARYLQVTGNLVAPERRAAQVHKPITRTQVTILLVLGTLAAVELGMGIALAIVG